MMPRPPKRGPSRRSAPPTEWSPPTKSLALRREWKSSSAAAMRWMRRSLWRSRSRWSNPPRATSAVAASCWSASPAAKQLSSTTAKWPPAKPPAICTSTRMGTSIKRPPSSAIVPSDRRGHNVREFHRAVGLQSQFETGHGPRDRDGTIADDGGLFIEVPILVDVHIAGGFAGGHFAVVEESCFAAGEADQHEAATADVARGGFDHRERERHSDRRIHRIAAALEDFHSRLRAKLFVGGDHPVGSADCLLGPRFGGLGVIARFCGSLPFCAGRKGQGHCQQEEDGNQYCSLDSNHKPKTLSDSRDSVKASYSGACCP